MMKTKQKAQECVIKRKLKFQDCESCLEAAEIENKINQLKNKFDVEGMFY